MARFISTGSPYLCIPYRALKFPATPRQLARGEGVQFRQGIFDTTDEALILALREYLSDFERGRQRKENAGVKILPAFYEENGSQEVEIFNEQEYLQEKEQERIKAEEQSKLMEEFYSRLRG